MQYIITKKIHLSTYRRLLEHVDEILNFNSMYVCMYVCVCVRAHMCVCMYVCVCIYIYIPYLLA